MVDQPQHKFVFIAKVVERGILLPYVLYLPSSLLC